MDDILDQTGQPVTNASISRTAEVALNTHYEKLPKDLGSHVVKYNVEPNFTAVVDGVLHKSTFVALTVNFENRETFAPFQFREYRDTDTNTQITQAAIANVAIGNFQVDFVASTDAEGLITLSMVPMPKTVNPAK